MSHSKILPPSIQAAKLGLAAFFAFFYTRVWDLSAQRQAVSAADAHGIQYKARKAFAIALLAIASMLACPSFAQSNVLPIPALTASVIDQTNTLTASEKQSITQHLNQLEDTFGAQVVVLMVASTMPEDIAAYANRVAQDWKIGRAKEGDGLLFVIAKDDRAMRLEVARGLEGVIPDIAAARIMDQVVAPYFRANRYAGGINAGIDAVQARLASDEQAVASAPVKLNGQASTVPSAQEKTSLAQWINSIFDSGFFVVFLIIILAVFAVIYYLLQRLRRAVGTPMSLLLAGGLSGGISYLLFASAATALIVAAVICLMVLGVISPRTLLAIAANSSRGGSGGGSGGRPRSGGGGSFGGGGASGRW